MLTMLFCVLDVTIKTLPNIKLCKKLVGIHNKTFSFSIKSPQSSQCLIHTSQRQIMTNAYSLSFCIVLKSKRFENYILCVISESIKLDKRMQNISEVGRISSFKIVD